MKFDSQLFESLSIFDLSVYTAKLIREPVDEADFFPYFISKAATMDAPRLELALAILGKVGTEAAFHKVAEHLVHPDYSVRLMATKIIVRLPTVSEYIMKCTVKSLKLFTNERMSPAKELKVVLDRPANERARQIAFEYSSKLGTRKGFGPNIKRGQS